MITLLHPELLFDKQKIYRLPKFVGKIASKQPDTAIKMLVVYSQAAQLLAESNKVLLDNLAKACKLNTDNARYVNATCELELLSEWDKRYPNALILLLGDISFDAKFQQVKVNELKKIGQSNLLKAPPLEQLSQSKEGKAELWRLLQIHFKLK